MFNPNNIWDPTLYRALQVIQNNRNNNTSYKNMTQYPWTSFTVDTDSS